MAKPKLGDIIEIEVNSGFAYALYTHENKLLGSLLRVFGHIYSARPNDLEPIISEEPQFEVFFPLAAAVQKRIVSVHENVEIPKKLRSFPIFRDSVVNPRTRAVQNWLWDGEREWPVGDLSEKEMRYPVRAIINDTLLKKRILSGYRALDNI